MSNRIQAALFRFSDPRKVATVFSLLLLALALAGCGNGMPTDCPSGGSGGSCGGG
jgi:hypothetical protein